MDLMTGLAAASQALGIAKQIRDIDVSFDKADFKLKIADITERLADVKLALLEAKSELDEKNAEIARFKTVLQFRVEAVIEHGGLNYWKRNDGTVDTIAFCPKCFNRGTHIKPMRQANANFAVCPECGNEYSVRALMYRGEDLKNTD